MKHSIEAFRLLMRRLKTAKNHSGASEQIPAHRLIRQGIPYYLNRTGYSFNPLTLFIVINGKCNLRCRMCDVGQHNENSMFYKNLKGDTGGDFPIERFKTLMDEVQHFKPFIGLTTTEPFLYPHIFDAVDYATHRGMPVNITTNGTLIEKHIDEIFESGLHRLSISLDGPARIHDKMRGVPGVYDKVIKGIERLKEEKLRRKSKYPYLYISSFVCDTNHQHLLEYVSNLPSNAIERLNMKLMVFTTQGIVEKHNQKYGDILPATVSCVPEDFSPYDIDVDVLYEQAKEINEKYGDFCTLYFEPDREKLYKYFHEPDQFMDATKCVFPWFVSQITANGDLITLTRCYNITLGNIMDRPFAEAWNGSQMRDFRKRLQKKGRFDGCSRCECMMSY